MHYFKIYILTASTVIYYNLYQTTVNQKKTKNLKKVNIK